MRLFIGLAEFRGEFFLLPTIRVWYSPGAIYCIDVTWMCWSLDFWIDRN